MKSIRRVARAGLVVLLIASLSMTLLHGWRLITGWPGSALVERTGEEIAADIERAIARHVDASTVIARLEELLQQEPRAWFAIEALEQVAMRRRIELPPELVERRNELHARDTGLINRSARCASCIWDLERCDFSMILICRGPIELTPLGDLASVIREGTKFALGRKVDLIDVGLSVLGLTAVALAPVSGGSSLSVKLGVGTAKTAWRTGRLSKGLIAPLRRAFRRGFDWSGIPAVRSLEELVALARPRVLRRAAGMASDFGRINLALGPRRTLYLLPEIGSPYQARVVADAAAGMGSERTLGAFEALGKARFIRASARWSDEIRWTVVGISGLMTSLLGLFLKAFASPVINMLRRLLRERDQDAD